jgi:hypothetical protein
MQIMLSRVLVLIVAGVGVAGFSLLPAAANECNFVCGSPPRCGKVCRLVCETKKLTAVCYACECDEICIPGPSRPGCKHCATCGLDGTCECGPACDGCQGHTPACEFCWRDWFACGCARPRTVTLLTKYEAEKEIGWYHWEVVDAACCDRVTDGGRAEPHRSIYKPAPADAELGAVLAVSDEEWAELASLLRPEENRTPAQLAAQSVTAPSGDTIAPDQKPEKTSLAERLGRLLKR